MTDPTKPRLEDLSLLSEPWCKELLSRPDIEIITEPDRRPSPPLFELCSNSLFSQTLWTDHTFRVWCPFRIKTANPRAPIYCAILAIGTGLDGATGRMHGGITSVVLDQVMGMGASEAVGYSIPTATKELTVQYKKPVGTPCVLLIRSTVAKLEDNRVWMEGTLEDGKGSVFAVGKGLFVKPREKKDVML